MVVESLSTELGVLQNLNMASVEIVFLSSLFFCYWKEGKTQRYNLLDTGIINISYCKWNYIVYVCVSNVSGATQFS